MPGKWRLLTIAVVLLSIPITASAFGPNGHRIVARIATLHISADTKREIVRLLGDRPLASGANWPDYMRDSPDHVFWNKAAAWHFINVPLGETYASSPKNPDGDAFTRLNYFLAQLRAGKASQEERVIALKWVTHLVGDLHQPLHCGHAKDAGGNNINVLWFNHAQNLHEVWDVGLIESENLSFSEFADFINTTDESRVAKIQEASINDWINESLQLRKTIYNLPSTNLGYQYAFDYSPMVKNQLLKAGLRLAAVLDKALGGKER